MNVFTETIYESIYMIIYDKIEFNNLYSQTF